MIANPFDRIVGGSGAQIVCNSDGSISVSLAAGKGFGLGANFQDIAQIAAPANPAAGTRRLFVDSGTGELSVKTSAGATVSLESGGGGGASTALNNLAAVSINASLIPQTTLDLGAAATAWRDLYLYGAGVFGAASLKITGTPTGNRVITIPDATDTLVNLATIQTLVNKTLTSPVLTTPFISGAVTFPDGVRQTFNPDATTPGLNVGSQAGDPSTPANGDLWYDSTGNLLRARINGATVSLGAGGGGSPGGANTQIQYNNGGAFGGITNFTSDGTNITKAVIDAATLLSFGGTTGSFPALKRSTTVLQVRLADDSGFTTIQALSFSTSAGGGFNGATLVADAGNSIQMQPGVNSWLFHTSGHFLSNSDNTYDIGATGANRPRNCFIGGNLTIGDAAALVKSSVAMNNGAGAGAGTLTNAPAAGNPTKWIPINDNGTTRYVPAW